MRQGFLDEFVLIFCMQHLLLGAGQSVLVDH